MAEISRYDRDLGERLRQVRDGLGLSQPAFAEKLGVSKLTVLRYEHGEGRPDPEFLAGVCRLGGVSPDWLLGVGSPAPTPAASAREKRAHSQLALIFSREDEDRTKVVEAVLQNAVERDDVAVRLSLEILRGALPPDGSLRSIGQSLLTALGELLGAPARPARKGRRAAGDE